MTYVATIPDVFPWESQVSQYDEATPPWDQGPENFPPFAPAAITYYGGETELGVVDCLLAWTWSAGGVQIVGILNHYGHDMPPWERAGNVNIWIRPDHQRQGIGTALWVEAVSRWNVFLTGQRFTTAGAAFATALTR